MIYISRGFTLVELIVVITIVWILATIGFVSYSGYLTGARDTNRISQLTKLSDALQVYETTKSLPLPDDYINISANGTLIWYQGYTGVDVLETLDYTNWGQDPLDDKYYTYYLAQDRSNYQLLGFMEETESVSFSPITQTHAVDYSDRFIKVYGQKLWVLTETTTNIPAQEVLWVTAIDLVTETESYMAHFTDSENIEWTGGILRESIIDGSCKRLQQSGKWGANGLYTINPGGNGNMTVYCDMENAWGGWTLIARSATGSTGNIWWGTASGSASDNDSHYSLWARSEDIAFSEILVARYTKKKNIDYAIKFDVNDANLDTSSSSTFTTSNCELMISSGLSSTELSWNHCYRFSYWWAASRTDNIFFRQSSWSNASGLNEDRFNMNSYDSTNGAWHEEQWMVFVK